MEPLTAGVIAVGTIVATKVLENNRKGNRNLLDKAGKFPYLKNTLQYLVAIEKAPSQPLDYGKAVLEVESAVNNLKQAC